LQAHIDLRIADHVCQKKRAAIAKSVGAFGNKFKRELCAGWLTYIS
jgi:hypothetical protein